VALLAIVASVGGVVRAQTFGSWLDPYRGTAQKLITEKIVSPDEVTAMTARRVAELEAELASAKATKQRPEAASMTAMWRGYRGGIMDAPEYVDTRVMMVLEFEERFRR